MINVYKSYEYDVRKLNENELNKLIANTHKQIYSLGISEDELKSAVFSAILGNFDWVGYDYSLENVLFTLYLYEFICYNKLSDALAKWKNSYTVRFSYVEPDEDAKTNTERKKDLFFSTLANAVSKYGQELLD